MDVFFCPEWQQQQHQTLVTKMTSRSITLWLHQQFISNLPGFLCTVNDQTVEFENVWEQWYPAANSSATHIFSSLIPMHALPSFLLLTIQQATETHVAAWERNPIPTSIYTTVTLWREKDAAKDGALCIYFHFHIIATLFAYFLVCHPCIFLHF